MMNIDGQVRISHRA